MSERSGKHSGLLPAVLLAAATTAMTPAARAATLVWGGSALDLNWNTPANWGGTLPGAADVAQFRENGYADGTTVATGADQTIGRLAFNYTTTADPLLAKNFTLSGNTITLNGVLNANGVNLGLNRDNNVGAVQTVDSNILLAASQQWNVAGNASATAGAGRVIVNGVVGETAGGAKDLTKGGGSPLELNGSNTFTGQTTVVQNTLVLGHANALGLGTSPVIIGNGAVNTNQTNLVTKGGVTFARDVLVKSGQTGGARLGGDGSGATTWTGTISLNRDVILTGGLGVATGTADFRGNIVDAADATNPFVSAGVSKVNGGTVKLAGTANTYSGPTTVTTGTLLVNGVLSANDALVTVAASARLGGTGTIGRPVSVAAGGILAPGDGGAGTLTVDGGKRLDLADGAVLEWQPGTTPATSDHVATSLVSFGAGATLRVLEGPGVSADPGASYVLLSWTGADPASLANWTFDPGLPLGGTISYVGASDGLPGGQVVLSNLTGGAAVPEPSSAAVAVFGIGVGWGMRRRGKR